MAVDIQQLVESRIKPALVIDATISTDLPTEIDAQVALQGWEMAELSDKQRVYVAALTLEGLMPRLALTYPEEAQELQVGPETIKLPSRADFLKLLEKAIQNLKKTAQREAAPEDEEQAKPARWPGCGVVGIG